MGEACSANGEMRNAYQILVLKPKERDYSGLGQGPMAGSWEHINARFGSIKCRNFLTS
jgi:hypothetical protein